MLLLSRFSRVRLCATQWMAAHQAPPSLGFSRQEHWRQREQRAGSPPRSVAPKPVFPFFHFGQKMEEPAHLERWREHFICGGWLVTEQS